MSGLLLDTHTLVWWSLDSPRLSLAARAAIMGVAPDVWVSAASVYEGDLKVRRGRIVGVDRSIAEIATAEGFGLLAIDADDAATAAAFDHAHGDPFDRLIAAQALARGMRVVTKDPEIAALGAAVVW